MEIIIGRQGDQALVIVDKTVSRKHCIITEADNGIIRIKNISPNGTYINDVKIEDSIVKKSDKVRLGPNFESTIADLLVRKESIGTPAQPSIGSCDESKSSFVLNLDIAKSYTNYRMVLKDYKRYSDLLSCLSAAEKESKNLPPYVLFSIRSAIAFKCIQSGRLQEAQDVLYKVGDEAYDYLDKSPEMESCYASVLILLAELYINVFRNEEAENAARIATGIFNRWTPGDLYIYPSIVGEAYSVFGDALMENGKCQMAKRCFNKAIELYKQSGLEDPILYGAKISELEKKLNAKSESKASLAPWVKRCCTCMYWCGHAEPNANVSLVYYTPGEWARCTNTYRGSTTGQPADQSCANWEQRFRLKNADNHCQKSVKDASNNKQRTVNQDFTTNCPKCGENSFTFRMNADTSRGNAYGKCNRCHFQAPVQYQNDSFDTRVIKIG